jgi:hypothetical protein
MEENLMRHVIRAASVVAALFALGAAPAQAEKTFGIGVILGDPSGLTGKVFLNENHALDFGLGDPLGKGFYLYGDYLLHFPGVFPPSEFSFYLGAGAGFHRWEKDNRGRGDDEENRLEARLPVGLEYMTQKVPLGLFVELAPALRISPDMEFEFRGGLGARYYF